jgi:hypothetical protein
MQGNEPIVHLKKRSPEAREAYFEGYKAGLKAARDGIQRSLDHFDDMLISMAQEENGKN